MQVSDKVNIVNYLYVMTRAQQIPPFAYGCSVYDSLNNFKTALKKCILDTTCIVISTF